MELVFDKNGREFVEVEGKAVVYNSTIYSIYEVGNCSETPRMNTIGIDGKTFKSERDGVYGGKEVGYVVEATRIDDNKFKCDTIWLQIEEMGWSEAETITNEEEIKFVQNILKQYGIELV